MKRKRNKKLDVYEQQREAHWRAEDRARLLKDIFPTVASLAICMTFKYQDSLLTNPATIDKRFAPEDKAFFKVQCPDGECINGGFDLSRVVSKLISARVNETNGTSTCKGWQDRERVGTHRCLLTMNYTIRAVYAKNPEANG